MSAAITIYSTTQAAQSAGSNSGSLDVQSVNALAIDVNISAISGAGATLTVIYERLGADGNWYPQYTSAGLTATGNTSANVGLGATTNAVLTNTGRLRWTIAGTTPSVTFTASVVGRV